MVRAVFPTGRSADSEWVFAEVHGVKGWVWVPAVLWDPDLSIDALPVVSEELTPGADLTETAAASAFPSSTPTQALTPTPGPTTTPAPATLVPTQTQQPTPAPTQIQPSTSASTATGTLQPAAVVPVPSVTPQPAPTQAAGPQGPPLIAPLSGWRGLLTIVVGVLVLLIALYAWRALSSRRELYRYVDGSPLKKCPICQTGNLILDEHVQRTLGLPVVRRTIRCDTCRSVLRQVRPGMWRYSIDPFVNEQLAQDYSGKVFADNRLDEFARAAQAFEPQHTTGTLRPSSETPEFQAVVEHLDELEAEVLAAGEQADAEALAAEQAEAEALAAEQAAAEAAEQNAPAEDDPPAEAEAPDGAA